MTEPLRVTACPKCDSPTIDERDDLSPTYRCFDCEHTFETPAERGNQKLSVDVVLVERLREQHREEWPDA